MEKNTAGHWAVFAYGAPDHATLAGKPVTGDAANITANVRIDAGAANAVDDVNPTELEGGQYAFNITADENNGELISIHPVSATPDVLVIGVPGAQWTRPPNFSDLAITASTGRVDMGLIAGLASSAAGLAQSTRAIVFGTATGTPTNIELRDSTLPATVSGTYNGRLLIMLTGPAAGEARFVTGFNAGTKALSFAAMQSTPLVTNEYVLV